MQLSVLSYYLNLYILPIIVVFGVVGNLLSVYIFTRPALHRSCSIYFLAGSINGLIILLFGTFIQWLTQIFPVLYATSISLEYCRFRTFMLYVLYNLAPYFTACITIDRFCSSSVHPKLRRLSSRARIAYIVIPIIIFITALAYIHIVIRFNIRNFRCQAEAGFYQNFFPFFTTGYYFIAIFIVLIFGLGTSYNIRIQTQRIQPMISTVTNSTTREKRRARGDSQLLLMLFIHVVCYAFLALPYHLSLIAAAIQPTLPMDKIFLFVYQISYITLNLSQAINFYVFTLTANLYRKELQNLINRLKLLFLAP
ncbi:unnamed protein product [Adineta ricciae]|uniref:G-protein coupled receptors family 1 profile domain-containing protein n=1 Tax=Adineta ricciae TaxID=249248 RepID=A0A814PZY4_ADIRI|nr:unnamed protein product [Adineta ricciae]CAF1228002.1 unnamed protein product [Adineta ricciae]